MSLDAEQSQPLEEVFAKPTVNGIEHSGASSEIQAADEATSEDSLPTKNTASGVARPLRNLSF